MQREVKKRLQYALTAVSTPAARPWIPPGPSYARSNALFLLNSRRCASGAIPCQDVAKFIDIGEGPNRLQGLLHNPRNHSRVALVTPVNPNDIDLH
jgi:hypothetical protein